ncbi:MAG: mannosyltransferase [Trizodia sp. TS-e1964]|nr:MAG: mannosyltransferase [Trizodia sp. TS-e1964]
MAPWASNNDIAAAYNADGPQPRAARGLAKGGKGIPLPSFISRTSPLITAKIAFSIFLGANALAALYAPVQDCDEVFNYWEPTHYLLHGYGLQTWEYSPEYAIRSWLYPSLHALVGLVAKLVPFTAKSAQFYFIRLALGFLCALCETRLFLVVSRTLSPLIGIFFMICMTTSTGMFHAATAYLPSSFSMYGAMLGAAAFMDWQGGLRTATGIMWFGGAAVVGWPFAAALAAPFVFEELLLASLSRQGSEAMSRLIDGTVRVLLVLALEVTISSYFYRNLQCVPLNIILYNVFSPPTKGPALYGTEPWHFYLRNLSLNFNLALPLALLALPLFALHTLLRARPLTHQTPLRTVVFLSPFYLWLLIFSLQPHKEERFMYPAYPFLALNASLTTHLLLTYLGRTTPRSLPSLLPPRLKLLLSSLFLLATLSLSLLRTLGQVTAYSAPLQIYSALTPPSAGGAPGDAVCLGKEWHRYASTFHLPRGLRPKFVRSAFDGLLPGEFAEARADAFGFRAGTYLPPPGMNDENRADVGKYFDVGKCTFMVDLDVGKAGVLEPLYARDARWEVVACVRFLDKERSGALGRVLWVPEWDVLPGPWRRAWGRYCLLRRAK